MSIKVVLIGLSVLTVVGCANIDLQKERVPAQTGDISNFKPFEGQVSFDSDKLKAIQLKYNKSYEQNEEKQAKEFFERNFNTITSQIAGFGARNGVTVQEIFTEPKNMSVRDGYVTVTAFVTTKEGPVCAVRYVSIERNGMVSSSAADSKATYGCR